MAGRVLVVDDEKMIVKGLKFSLMQDYSVVDCAYDGEEALEYAKNNEYDIILLDIMLPKLDGLSVCQQIREFSDVPIIMLTAKGDDMDKILGLEYGADDYITKPFSVEELLARLRVTQRRIAMMESESSAGAAVFSNGQLRIDYAAGCAYLNEQELHLTPIEYKLLCILSQNVGKVLTHTYITQKIWGHSWENDIASLRVFMATLRKKIEIPPESPQYIQTHIGVGYRMLRVE